MTPIFFFVTRTPCPTIFGSTLSRPVLATSQIKKPCRKLLQMLRLSDIQTAKNSRGNCSFFEKYECTMILMDGQFEPTGGSEVRRRSGRNSHS